tara:strand:- start:612 stop:812 length:201 start_codon:yes stop_codon:yes gene_type:complete
MGCFNILFLLALVAIYFIPDLRPIMDVEGFWLWVVILWAAYFISWALFGDIADEIAGVNKYNDDEF